MLTVLKTITTRGLVVLILSGLLISKGRTMEAMTAEMLLSVCKDAGDQAAPAARHICHGYIRGYLDAVGDLTLAQQADESFQQRALKTRARGQMMQDGVMVRSPYCLPEDLSVGDVVNKLEREEATSGANVSAAELLSSALKKHFTCP
ncbi:MAG: hypothetical protein EP323_03835 [Gammaproteobacteria bacterium]|nr:MAG: hypothetical protein EP323_03835 [Gammaproteobacteria bacterium]